MYSFYRTTNLVTGKVYYGIHKESKYPEIDSYLGSGVALTASVEKYGRDNFKREILEYRSTIEEVYAIEKRVVTKELVESEDTYNLCGGGEGPSVMSTTTRKKMSESHKTRPPHTEETKAKIGNGTKNPSINTRKLLRDANHGIKLYNNGTVNKRCFPGMEPTGFVLGTLCSLQK